MLNNLHSCGCSCPFNSALVLVLLALFDTSSVHLYICIVAPHLGTLEVQHVNVKYAVLEPNHKTVFGGHLQKMEGTAKATDDPAQGRKGPRP